MVTTNWKEALAKASILGGIAFFSVFSSFPDAPILLLIRPALVAFGIAFLAVLKSIENNGFTTQAKSKTESVV